MKKLFYRLTAILFPPKCVLCRCLLQKHETDICGRCYRDTPEYIHANIKLSYVARWTAVWYYKENVRKSILRYKFGRARHYAPFYGRVLAMRLLRRQMDQADILTWVPTGRRRIRRRGFDQCALLARSVGQELGMTPVSVLKKIKDTPPQSGMKSAAQRRANVLGVYQVNEPAQVAGKRILLLDDVITTGATVSECARVLLAAGAKEVICAAVAAASHDNKK